MEYDHFLVIPKRATAEHLAAMYFDIHTAFGMLKGVCGAEGGRVTRQDAKFVEDAIIPVYDYIEDAMRKATAEINESKADAARSSMVKLTDAERNRRFLEGGATLPADPAMRYCPYCKCKGTVDIPVENEEKRARNMRRLQEYSREKERWELAKVNGATVERTGSRGNICERAPKRPTMERLPWVCHCHQMRNPNPQRPDNNTSTCAMKCRNGDGIVYEYDKVKRKVTCPSCLCNCTAAFEVSGGGEARISSIIFI